MITKLIRQEDGRLSQNGIADGGPIDLRKQAIMRRVSRSRLTQSTPAEKKLTFHLQVLTWAMGERICPYQREKTVHIADILSRSLDFYFSCSKLGLEVDGGSHNGEMQAAKDEWTDKLILEHAKIQILRFKNAQVFDAPHSVIVQILSALLVRHNWPRRIREDFQLLMGRAASKDGWDSIVVKFLDDRRK